MKIWKTAAWLLVALAWATGTEGAVRTEVVEYRHGDVVLEGLIAYDDAIEGRRPGVLVIHEWTGLGAFVQERAEQLAKDGAIAMGIDMYGKGIRPQTPQEAAKEASLYKSDRTFMRARAQAGLDLLRNHPLVDPRRIAAIGFCFGGTTALELARSGAELAGAVCFHGNLDTPIRSDAKKIRGKILVCHGGDDPYVSWDEVAAFREEMRDAGVDWQLHVYGGAVHSFTNPAAGADKSRGAAYHEPAARRSWQAMKDLFAEILYR